MSLSNGLSKIVKEKESRRGRRSEDIKMNESNESGLGGSQPAQGMGVAAADFRRNVQEASERLSNAGSQLVSMSQELAAAIAEAKAAAQQAQTAQSAAEAAKAAAEATKA